MTVLEPAANPRGIVDPENPAVGVAELPGLPGRVVFFVAIAFCFFQIITAAFSPLSSIVLRSVHVGFLLFLTFMLFRVGEMDRRRTVPLHDWMLAIMAFALGLYHWVFEADLIQRAGQPNTADIVVGSVVILLVFEAARRIMGWSLPLMCVVFIPYALFGRSLPSFLSHRGFAYEQVVDQLYLGTEGIYGVPTFVSATYIFLFILFGAFLERAGTPQTVAELANHRGILTRTDLDHWTIDNQSIRVLWHISTGNMLVTRDAVCAGLGIALLPEYLADAPIAEESLVRILPESRLDQVEATALQARSVTPPVAVKALLKHLT